MKVWPANPVDALHSKKNLRLGTRLALAVLFLLATFDAFAQTTITNVVTVSPPAGVTDPSCNVANPPCNSASDTDAVTRSANLSLTKSASPEPVAVGQLLTYTLTLTNAGPSAVSASDTLSILESLPAGLTGCNFTPSAGTFNAGTIASGSSGTGTWTGVGISSGGTATLSITCTVGSSAAASITNTATVIPPTGITDPDCSGAPVTCAGNNTGSVTTAVNRPQLTFTKTASAASFTVGVPASYTLSVQNTGTSATTAASTITDNVPSGLTIGTLPAGCTAAGQTVTCTIAAGLAAGSSTSFIIPITPTISAASPSVNTASVSGGGDPTCPAASRCSSTTTTPVIDIRQTIVKSNATLQTDADGNGVISQGDTLSYIVTVTNTGNVALTNVQVNDAQLTPNSTTCASVAPAATCVLSGTHIVTLAEATANQVVNTANTTSTEIPGPTSSNTVTTSVIRASFTLNKTADPPTVNLGANNLVTDAGDTITYTFSVTNTGNVTINSISVTDPLLPSLVCTIASLAPGNSANCVPSNNVYTLTQANIDAGQVVNTATAAGTPTSGVLPSATDTETVNLSGVGSLTLNKTSSVADTNGNTVTGDAGDVITYSFAVTNTGTLALTNVVVSDPLLPSLSCTIANLAVGATTSCVATNNTYTITAADVTAGSRANTASVDADNVGTINVTPATDTETVTTSAGVISQTIVKSAATLSIDLDNNGLVTQGDTLSYTVTVTNTGNVPLSNVIVNDPQLTASSIACLIVAPGNTCVLTGTHVVTAGEASAGQVVNTANTTSNEIPGPTNSTQIITPVATLSVAIGDATSVNEGTSLVYTVTLSGGTSTSDIVIPLTYAGTADPVLDINGQPVTVTILAGQTTGTVTVPTLVDSVLEGNETVLVNLGSATVGVTITDAQGSGTIMDVAPSLTVAIGDATSVNEGTSLVYTVTLSGGTSISDIVIPLTYAGTADPVLDISGQPVTVTILAGQVTATVTVPTIDDAIDELDETVLVNLGATPVGVTVTDGQGTGTIIDNDARLVTIGDAAAVNEGSNLSYTVSLSTPSLTDTIITISLNGTATAGVDYTSPSLTITIPAGSTTVNVVVPSLNDVQNEVTETVIITITGVTSGDASLGATLVGTGSILDNDTDLTPIANDDVTVFTEGDPVSGTVIGNDTPGNGISVYSQLTNPANGSLVFSPDGSYTYTPNPGFVGNDSFTYQICDADVPPDCDDATVTFTVVPKLDKLRLRKEVNPTQVTAGSLISYTLTIQNIGALPVFGANVVDTPPAGFNFVPGSVVIVDTDNAGTTSGTGPITFSGIDIAAGATATIRYMLRVSAGLPSGEFVNQATVFQLGVAVSNSASAAVTMAGGTDPLFEQSRILGKVWDDKDGDGWQGEGEKGIPGVRIATVEGWIAETDSKGRYHFEGITLSNQERGQNVVVKVDKSTIPEGAVFTTENPLLRRVTPAIPVRFDFGVKLPPPPKVIAPDPEPETMPEAATSIELGAVYFDTDRTTIKPEYSRMLDEIAAQIEIAKGGTVVLTGYADMRGTEEYNRNLAMRRAKAVLTDIASRLSPEAKANLKVEVEAAGTLPGAGK